MKILEYALGLVRSLWWRIEILTDVKWFKTASHLPQQQYMQASQREGDVPDAPSHTPG